MVLYFGYGSNLHPLRISRRLGTLDPLGVDWLEGFALTFDMLGGDGSAKCNIRPATEADCLHGACYELASDQWHALLDYETHEARRSSGQLAKTFVAEPERANASIPPFSWYRDIVVAGIALPRGYLDRSRSVDAGRDPDLARSAEMLRANP